MKVGTWNVLSWYRPGAAKRTIEQIEKYNIDITALQEIRWPNNGNLNISQSVIFYSGKQDGRHEFGTGFAVRDRLMGQIISFKPISERICYLRVKGKWHNYSLVSAYAPTEEKEETDKDSFYDQLEDTISTIPRQDMLILLGDFNAKVGKEPALRPHIGNHSLHDISNDNGQRLAGLAAANNLMVVSTMFEHKNIHKETWVSNDHKTRNQIDHVLVNARYAKNVIDVKSRRGADADSDHFLVQAKMHLRIKNTKTKEQQAARTIKWEVNALRNAETRNKYQTEMENEIRQNTHETEEREDIERGWSTLRSTILAATKKILGKKNRTKGKEWYDAECEQIQNEKNKARVRMIQDSTNVNIEKFQTCRKEARKLIRNKKRAAQNKVLQQLEEDARSNNSRRFFQEISQMKKGYKPKTSNILKREGDELITDTTEILKTWKEYFSNLLKPGNDETTATTTYQTAEIEIEEPNLQEIIRAINKLKNNKAPGCDTIPAECLKYGGTQLHKELHKLILDIWKREALPDEWNEGIIIPIHKKGDRMKCANYRGISLLNAAYKVLSNVLLNRIAPYAEEHIGDYQCGFRPKRSTVDQIFTIRQLIEKHWEFNKDVHQLFMDFRQAYDTIIRDSVWIAMASIGTPQKIITLTKMCVNNTRCRVKIGNQITEDFSVMSGLRQGDGLSPLLFNIVLDMAIKRTNITTEVFTNKGPQMILAFADDIDAVGGSTVGVKETFLKIEKECKKVGLNINEEKTKYMHITRQPTRDRIGQNVTMDTYNFECVRQFKYLGATICSDNDSNEEIKTRIQSGNRCFFAMRTFMQPKTISRVSKLKVYQAVIKPIICYGCETWTLTKHNELLLKRFERKILRRIFGPLKDPNTEQYRIRTNAEVQDLYQKPDIVKTIKSQRLRWAGHVQRAPHDRMIKLVWEGNPTGKRPLGRPRLRWRDNILKDMQTMQVDDWREAMMDRDRWRQIVNAAKTHQGL